MHVKNVSLQTSWRQGARLVEEECPFLVPVLKELEKDPSIDIFSPFVLKPYKSQNSEVWNKCGKCGNISE